MKYIPITTLFLLLLFANFCNADCGNRGVWVVGNNKTMSPKGIIVLDSYASSQKTIANLGKQNNAYLKSSNEKVRLTVKEIYKGALSLTQVVLIPEKKLTIGATYTLYIASGSDAQAITKWNSKKQKQESVKYKIVAQDLSETYSNITAPTKTKNIYARYGCGPAIYVVFNFSVKKNSTLWTKATVTNLSSGQTRANILNAKNGQIRIGHGMCSGAFDLEQKENYQVTFEILTHEGKLLKWNKKPIQFSGPTLANSSHKEFD